MRKRLLLIGLLLSCGLILAGSAFAATVTEEWVARYNGPGYYFNMDIAKDMAVDSSGNVYVTGYSTGFGYDYATIKYDSAGNELWVRRYSGLGAYSLDQACAIALDNSGNVYVTGYSGYSYPGTDYDYATIKYDANGNEQWVARYNGLGNGNDRATAIAVDAYGNVYVTGYSFSGSNFDYVTIKYNSAGVPQWTSPARYDGSNVDLPRAMLLSKDDGQDYVYVTGSSYSNGTHYDYATVKYDAATGTQLWVARYVGPYSYDFVSAIALDSAGNIYVTGESRASSTDYYDYATVKYNSLGAQQWEARYNNVNGSDHATDIAVDALDNVYVTGYSAQGSNWLSPIDYATVKYNSAGVQQWVANYISSAYNMARAIALDRAGNVYITGFSSGNGAYYDYATVKYNTNGVQQWEARYNGPATYSYDEASAIALDNLGNVYVTGTSNNDYATIKYSQFVVVAIDIKPGSDPNSINLSSAGVIPVAILSSNTFNAATVDPAKVSLAGAGVKLVGKSDKYLSHEEDVNGDGLLDLVCQVNTAQFMIEPGESSAVLEANTFDGTPIRGEDFVRIIAE